LTAAAPAVASEPVPFARAIQPVLKASCYQCHGPERHEAGLRLDSRAALLKGGAGGPALVPGRSAHSRLVQRLLGQGGGPRMPLGFAPLPKAQIDRIRAWIDQGAVWPEVADARRHWAWIKPIRRALTKARNATWVRNPIDQFVLARVEREDVKNSPEAARGMLIRR